MCKAQSQLPHKTETHTYMQQKGQFVAVTRFHRTEETDRGNAFCLSWMIFESENDLFKPNKHYWFRLQFGFVLLPS